MTAHRSPLTPEPSLLELGWKVLFILFAFGLIAATAVTQASAWMQAGRTATVQASALSHECPLPKLTEHLVITVKWANNRVVTRCLLSQSQGAYLSERRP